MKRCFSCREEKNESEFPHLSVSEVLKDEQHGTNRHIETTVPYRRLWMCKDCWRALVSEPS
jgi:hypothetical protein